MRDSNTSTSEWDAKRHGCAICRVSRLVRCALLLVSLLFVNGCVCVRWSWAVEDGAVYETTQNVYIVDDHLAWFVSERNKLAYADENFSEEQDLIALSVRTKIREVKQVGRWGFLFWWYFGPYSQTTTFGEIADGPRQGLVVNLGYYQRCSEHGWDPRCPLDCPSRILKCLTPEKYDQNVR